MENITLNYLSVPKFPKSYKDVHLFATEQEAKDFAYEKDETYFIAKLIAETEYKNTKEIKLYN